MKKYFLNPVNAAIAVATMATAIAQGAPTYARTLQNCVAKTQDGLTSIRFVIQEINRILDPVSGDLEFVRQQLLFETNPWIAEKAFQLLYTHRASGLNVGFSLGTVRPAYPEIFEMSVTSRQSEVTAGKLLVGDNSGRRRNEFAIGKYQSYSYQCVNAQR